MLSSNKTRLLTRVAQRQWLSSRAGSLRSIGCWPKRGLLSASLVLVGLLLVSFAVGSYSWMFGKQQSLTTRWKVQDQHDSLQGAAHRAVTLLAIPKINLEAAILEGTSRRSLLLAPAHLENTAWPGDSGNSVIAGHRDTFFRHIHDLSQGDDIYVRRNGRQYHYVVTSKAVVSPSDMSVTYPTTDTRLTLVTCYPTFYIGPAPKRLVVVATLEPDSGSSSAAKRRAEAKISP